MTSIYEQLGGEPAVNAAVDIFYKKVLADPTISHFFDDVDMAKQIQHQKAFLTVAFGGPNHYTGRSLRESHKHLNLNEEHFNAVAGHLQSTLNELEVPPELSEQVMTLVASTKDDVLNRNAA